MSDTDHEKQLTLPAFTEKRSPTAQVLAAVAPLLDRDQCRALLAQVLGRELQSCPYCQRPLTPRVQERLASGGRVLCVGCRTKFGLWTGTPLQGGHLHPEEVVLAWLTRLASRDRGEFRRLAGRQRDFASSWWCRLQQLEAKLVNRCTKGGTP